ncbi:MAG: polysaccharide pyruvyl transferase family protein [Ferruginibacter sp.]|nr:polysaccharide pyruvyl transferase family protein [Ferruginibacter sp.]
MKKVFLITKLKTSNLGNEALSNEIIRLFSEAVSHDDILSVNGRPFGLEGYYRNRIVNAKDPGALIDQWATHIAAKIKKEPNRPFNRVVPEIAIIQQQGKEVRFEPLKAKLRPLKRVLQAFKVYPKQYAKRAGLLKQADWLIYSGAGEVCDNNIFLRQLVELRAAQMLGIKTAAVNQSVVIKTPLFQKLTGHVYSKLNKIVVRGSVTRNNLISYGVPENIIEMAPDSAINAQFTSTVNRMPNRVGINFTPKCKLQINDYRRVVEKLRSLNLEPLFVTNEPFEDNAIALQFKQELGVEVLTGVPDYHTYMQHLATCRFIVSARLHTNILALDTRTPVIPIEGNIFKTAELLQQLGYPVSTLNPQQSGWVDDLIRSIENIYNNDQDVQAFFRDTLHVQQQAVKRNAQWLKES